MRNLTRRQAGRILLSGTAGLALAPRVSLAAALIDSVVRGVQLGAQSFSFRDRDLDGCAQAFVECGLGECELWQAYLEPQGRNAEELRKWRLETPLSFFHDVRAKFENAGVRLAAFYHNFDKSMNDAEFDRVFQFAHALGVKIINGAAQVSMAPRIDALAQKYKIRVGFHGGDSTRDPEQFSTADTFARAMKGASKYIGVNLDIGHFTAAGGDALAYLREHHDRITTLHIKDRKKDHGPHVPFGEGDAPIGPVLRMVRDNHWKIPANIEYEYGQKGDGRDSVAEMKKCFAYCKKEVEA